MTVEIRLNLANGFYVDHALESIADALYFSNNVTQDEYNLVYFILTEIKKSNNMERNVIFGQIPASVGFTRTEGTVRELNLRYKLQQVLNLRGVTTIDHPVHGTIQVSDERAAELLSSGATNEHLIRYKLSLFQ